MGEGKSAAVNNNLSQGERLVFFYVLFTLHTKKLPPIGLLGHSTIIFGKKFEQPQENRNGTSEEKVS